MATVVPSQAIPFQGRQPVLGAPFTFQAAAPANQLQLPIFSHSQPQPPAGYPALSPANLQQPAQTSTSRQTQAQPLSVSPKYQQLFPQQLAVPTAQNLRPSFRPNRPGFGSPISSTQSVVSFSGTSASTACSTRSIRKVPDATATKAIKAFLEYHGFFNVNEKRLALGRTSYPLHVAVREGNIAMVHALLDAGSDPMVTTTMGFTAEDLARKREFHEIVQLIEKYKPAYSDAASPFHSILSNGQSPMNREARTVTSKRLEYVQAPPA